jgi:hypothetical protein
MHCALSVIPSGSGMSKIPQNITSPAKSTTICFLNVFSIKEARQKKFNELILTEGRKKSYSEGMDKYITGKEAVLLILVQ